MRFAHWPVLLLALLVPLLWYYWSRPRNRATIRFSDLSVLRRAAGTGWARVRLILPLLRTAALLCLIVGVARPQRADESSRVFAEGIAIQLVVDRSGSMLDGDLSPRGQRWTRLDVVKEVVRRFVSGEGDELPGRTNDLVGLIAFARYPDSVCPLTLDHASLLETLQQTQIVDARRFPDDDGTAIGDALALAVERLKDLKRATGSGEQLVITSRVVILLTDGENNAGVLTPEQAGELAATYGIKVYTILAGTGQRTPIGRLPVDDADLRKIADLTGGRHFRAADPQALLKVYAQIDQLERSRVEERRFLRWSELNRPWLLAAFICVCGLVFLDSTWLRKIP